MEQRNGWTIDLSACQVWHDSGLSITFEGNPSSSHFGGSPCRPEGISNHRFIALVREGFELYRRCYGSEQPERETQENRNSGVPPSRGRAPIIIRRRSRLSLSNSSDTQ